MTKQTYGQYCPVAKAVEVLAERWTPLILRNLLLRPHRFNELERGLPGISRALLVQRLSRLERAGVITRQPMAGGQGVAWFYIRGIIGVLLVILAIDLVVEGIRALGRNKKAAQAAK